MDYRRIVLVACIGAFMAACAPKPEPMPMADPVSVEPTYTGKL